MQAIAPERAQRLSARDTKQTLDGMLGEWETFKQAWSR
jgi:hypothetical protein